MFRHHADGGLLTAPFEGGPVAADEPSNGYFAVIRGVWDGGSDLSERSFDLAVVRDGGLVTLAHFDDETVGVHFRLHTIGPKLMLATWSERLVEGTCNDCSLGGLYGEYICAPPP